MAAKRLTLVDAARQLRKDMTQLDNDIHRVAVSAGTFMALLDNADDVQTLTSVRSDTTFQYVSNLGEAYGHLADYLRTLTKPDDNART